MPYIKTTVFTARACISGILLFIFFPYLSGPIRLATHYDSIEYIFLNIVLFVFTAIVTYVPINLVLQWIEKRSEEWINTSSLSLEDWANSISPRALRLSIVITSGITLFMELALIRWQSSLFPVFALYKNFTLLACFCGLGVGYALSRKSPLFLIASLPVLALLLFLLTVLRYGASDAVLGILYIVPVQEEAAVTGAFINYTSWIDKGIFYLPVYLLLMAAFALNVLVLLPVGQFCGYMMERGTPLVSYGCNLLGSIAGVAIMFICGWLWTGPVIWFGLIMVFLLWYQQPSSLARRVGIFSVAVCIGVLAWPVEPLVQSVYSPYQLIQKTTKPDGLMRILAAGTYYQKVYDLSLANANREKDPALKKIIGYYELPFHTAPSLKKVAIVGAGSGNDVAAALRAGAENVDAVEIDPVIRDLGKLNHPEHPYQNPQVHPIINDARTFFRNTQGHYDAIVYGVLDSHILLSHGSNVRLDSFVYTREGLQEAFERLNSGGLMSVSFALLYADMGKKIYTILKQFPGAGAPVAVATGYDSLGTTTFMVRKNGKVDLPVDFIEHYDLRDITQQYVHTAGAGIDIPTDDWPFFYMDKRMYPVSYMISLIFILLLSLRMTNIFLPGQKLEVSLLPFLFLGSGFMLIETKAITELGLLFGNTWYVVGITIISVLIMAFIANAIAAHLPDRVLFPAYLLLGVIIMTGYAVSIHGGISHADAASKLALVALLTGPLFFSGIIFSLLFKNSDNITGAMSYNLIGAILGGLLEYNSMRYGFAFLYIVALALYGLAWAASFFPKMFYRAVRR